jgi:O-antigen ligase/Tfp pilus assembly protein PilF
MEACWLGGLVAVPLLVNPGGGFAFSIYKAALLCTLAGLMVALWLLKAGLSLGFTPASWRPRALAPHGLARGFLKAPLMGPVLALALVYLLATALSISPATSLWGSASRMEGTYTILVFMAFFLVVAWELRSAAQLHRVVWAVLLGSGLVSLLAIAEWLGWSPWLLERTYGTWRVGATTGHPTLLGAYLVLTMALLMGKVAHLWASRREQPPGRVALRLAGLSGLFSLHLVALLFTNARGPWLGLGAMITVFLAILLVKNRRWRMLRLAGLLVVLGLVFSFGLSQSTPPLQGLSQLPYLSRMAEMADIESGSGRERVVIWGATKNLLINHPTVLLSGDPVNWARPLLGYGPETLLLAFEKVFPPELRHLEPETRVDRAHNLVLDLMVTVGFLGLLAFAWVVGSFFFHACRLLKSTRRREEEPLLAALVAAVAGYLVTQLVGISALADHLVFWTLLALLVALARGVAWERPAPPYRQASLAGNNKPPVLEAISKPLTPSEPPQRRISGWLLARKGGLPGSTALAVGLGIAVFSVYINAHLVWADLQTRKGVDFMKQARWKEAASSLEQALRSPPLRALNNWHLAQVYSFQALASPEPTEQASLLALASARIEEARALEPAAAGYHQRAGLIYSYWALTLDPTKYGEAAQAFTQAAALSPNEVNIYNQWADLEARSLNYERSLELLHQSLDVDPAWAPTQHQLASVYVSIGKPAQARPYAERYVQAQPTRWEGRLLLAKVYLGLGMTSAALEQATLALSLAPAPFQEQVRQLMDSLR